MRGRRRAIARGLSAGLLLCLGAVLARAVWSLSASTKGLTEAALASLDRTGVENPVTAVLLNYRGYDTLLEICVLFLALLGVWSSAVRPRRHHRPPGIVLLFLNQLLVPFLILFSGYLLWAGSDVPGGAFQAGAVAAAAGVLAYLSGIELQFNVPRFVERALLVLGLVVFVAIGAGTASVGNFLEFPEAYAKPLILAIETAATVSIGLGLLGIFRGGRPRLAEQEAERTGRQAVER